MIATDVMDQLQTDITWLSQKKTVIPNRSSELQINLLAPKTWEITPVMYATNAHTKISVKKNQAWMLFFAFLTFFHPNFFLAHLDFSRPN